MLQLVYISTPRPGGEDLGAILQVSQRNNLRDGLTGLLFANGKRFLQVLEGPTAAVEAAFARVAVDPRHRAIVVLSRREIAEREFGNWAMAAPLGQEAEQALVDRVAVLAAAASPAIRATFESFAKLKQAA